MRSPPILTDTYDLVLSLYRRLPDLPKTHRQVLGQRLERTALDVLLAVHRAATDRAARSAALGTAGAGLDELRLLLRLSVDLALISHAQHEQILFNLDQIGKQLGGWQKWDQQDLR